MGLFGRGFKTKKFTSKVNLAISRLGVLRKQHQSRCSAAMSDVTQILKQGHQDRALLRAEQVVKEQNMLDVLGMIDTYCYLLIERVSLLEHAKNCPEELKEGISSLVCVATRCGEFPELQDLRAIFASRFGKEFVDRAAQLRNNCGVSPKIIQKLSTRMHTIESRMKVLREIAKENNIVLQIEEDGSVHRKENMEAEEKREDQPGTMKSTTAPEESRKSLVVKGSNEREDVRMLDRMSGAVKMKGKYKDVAHAAQAAFECAANAAQAARAAVELSWFDSQTSDDQNSPKHSTQQPIVEVSDSREIIISEPQSIQANQPKSVRDMNSEDTQQKLNHNEKKSLVTSQSTSSEDSESNKLKEIEEHSDEEEIIRTQVKKAIFDSIDFDTIDGGRMLLFESYINDEAAGSKIVNKEKFY